jgi:hypothetical protein
MQTSFRFILNQTPSCEESNRIEKGKNPFREVHGQVNPVGLTLSRDAGSGWDSGKGLGGLGLN